MSLMSNVWKLYVARFFFNLVPAYVIERLYWETKGMTVELVVYTEMLFALAIVLLEVPTGIIADRWGRKRMIVLAAAIGCCEFLFLLYAAEFWHFALVILLTAVGNSAISGAESALLYDSLVTAGEERRFEHYAGRLNALDIAAVMIAALSGSLLAGRFGFELNYWLSLGSMLIALACTLLLVEPAAGEAEEQPLPIRTYLTASLQLFRRDSGLLLVVLSGMVTGAAVNFIDEFWQTYLDRVGVPVVYFGLFSAAMFLLRLPGNMAAYKLRSRFGYRPLLACATAVLAASFLWLSAARDYSGLAAIGLIGLFAGMIEPLAAGYLHRRTDSSMRATVASFQSLGENAALIVAGAGFGFFASRWDVFGGYGFIGVVCGAFAVYFLLASAGKVD